MKRVLILACSQRKRMDFGLLSAIERYDGPTFRVLRRYLRNHPLCSPDIHILSAEFGLISATHLIPNYDRPMTITRARALQPPVQESLTKILKGFSWEGPAPQQLLICLGRNYREALAGYAGPAAEVLPDRCIVAGLGTRLTLLRDWLHETGVSPSDGKEIITKRRPAASQLSETDVTTK